MNLDRLWMQVVRGGYGSKAGCRMTPYQDLHVYLLSGEVFEEEEKDLGEGFNGLGES